MFGNLALVFRIYGGVRALFGSSYIYVAILLALLSHRKIEDGSWSAITLQVIPNILGFSIAALTVVMTIGNDRFREAMAQVRTVDDEESDLTVTTSNFIWFIFVQVIALLFAITFDAKPFPTLCGTDSAQCSCNYWVNVAFSAIGSFLFFYSILLILAAVFQAFHLFRLFIRNQ